MEKKQPKKLTLKDIPAGRLWMFGYVLVLALAAGLVYFWRSSFQLGAVPQLPFTLGVAGLFTVLYIAAFCIWRFARGKLALQAALCVLGLGLVFVFATPPLQVPDEAIHYQRAYTISTGRLNYNGARTYPDDVAYLLQSFPANMQHRVSYNNGELALKHFAEYNRLLEEKPPVAEAPSESGALIFMSLPYLPQALAMAMARLFGFSALGILYAGRIGNLLLYALVCFFAFRNCDKYRGVFFALGLLPLSLFLAASCSYDGLMLALCYLAVSYFCKAEIHTKDVWGFGVAVALATYIKPMNIALAAVLLLVPKIRWKTKIKPWAAFGVILLGGALMYGVVGQLVDGGLLKSNYPAVLPRGTGEGAAPGAQLQFVLSNPLAFISKIVLTITENAGFLFTLGTFGAMDLSIPLASGLSVMGMAGASALGIQQKEDTKAGGALGLFLAFGLYTAAIIGGMYIQVNHYQAPLIGELQPRYFLPAFLLLFMLLSILLGKAVRPRLAAGNQGTLRTEQITLLIVAAVALVTVMLLFQGNFVGRWVEKLAGGHKMVNLLGWQVT